MPSLQSQLPRPGHDRAQERLDVLEVWFHFRLQADRFIPAHDIGFEAVARDVPPDQGSTLASLRSVAVEPRRS